MYQIKEYTYDKAKIYGVDIKPSIKKNKKIDVFKKNGKYICSIGSIKNSDYPTYIETHGKEYADKRKKLYLKRHENDFDIAGFYAKVLLW